MSLLACAIMQVLARQRQEEGIQDTPHPRNEFKDCLGPFFFFIGSPVTKNKQDGKVLRLLIEVNWLAGKQFGNVYQISLLPE